MALTQETFNGDGSNLGPFSFTFKWLRASDIKVSVNNVLKTAGTHYNLQNLNYTTKTGGQVLFTAGNAPAAGTGNIRIYRNTDSASLISTFGSGSAIRAVDLNDNFTQILYYSEETQTFAEGADASAIQTTATTALNNSNTAVSTANAAQATANSASTTANGIAATASSALTIAQSAEITAQSAATTANAISATATNAQTIANIALTTATNAQTTATSAETTANDALARSGGTMTGLVTFASTQTFPRVPQNAKTAPYTLIASDAGKHISITTGGITVPFNVFSVGDTISVFNNSASPQAITQATGVTLRLAGVASTGNRTLAQYGICQILCVASNVFVTSGAGLT
jgi:hypothetical protein